jgi:hypothetical protein
MVSASLSNTKDKNTLIEGMFVCTTVPFFAGRHRGFSYLPEKFGKSCHGEALRRLTNNDGSERLTGSRSSADIATTTD